MLVRIDVTFPTFNYFFAKFNNHQEHFTVGNISLMVGNVFSVQCTNGIR